MEVDSADGSGSSRLQLRAPSEVLPLGPSFQLRTYPDDHPRRGKAIIFNHVFQGDARFERKGSEKDADRLRVELGFLGFEVEELVDPTYEDIKKKLEETAKEDHTDADCVAVFVMSHGGQKHPDQKPAANRDFPNEKFSMQLILAKDRVYDEKELFTPFEGDKCKTLLNKPKVFFIQACRSDASSGGEKANKFMISNSEICSGGTKGGFIMCTTPKGADFLIFRATVDYTFAWREPTGSWFIQALCDELERNRTRQEGMMHLESLFREVKLNFVCRQNKKNIERGMTPEEIDKEGSYRSQIPCVFSTTLREIYWKPKKLVKYEAKKEINN